MATEFDDRMDDKDMKQALNAWRESADKQAERPDWFWARQRARIESRQNERKVKHFPSLAWAGIAATVAIGVALMIPVPNTQHNDQPPSPQIATVKPPASVPTDHELMQQLEATMNSGVPDALQPASTLAQEMEQAYTAGTSSRVKERMQ